MEFPDWVQVKEKTRYQGQPLYDALHVVIYNFLILVVFLYIRYWNDLLHI